MSAVLQSYRPVLGGESPVPPAPRAYTIQDLGLHLDGGPLLPAALNDHGHLAAVTIAPTGTPGTGAVHHGLCLTGYLRTPANQAINRDPVTSIARNGFAAGTAGESEGTFQAWCTPRGAFGAALWPEYNSLARGINARGHTVGEVHMQAEGHTFSRAFFLGDTCEPRLLTPPRGGTTSATAINDAGDLVLNSIPFGATAAESRAWCLQAGRFTALPGLDGSGWAAHALTPYSRAAGWALTAAGEKHACLWDENGITDLGTLPVHSSEALALNDQRTVVGRLADPQGNRRAFRWTPEEGLVLLDHTVVTPLGWQLLEAVAVNAHGQIAVRGLLHGQPRGALLHPVGLG